MDIDIDKIIREVTMQVGGFQPPHSAQGPQYSAPAKDVGTHLPVYSMPVGRETIGSRADVITKLEHSVLNPDLSDDKLEAAAGIARKYSVAALCVSPYYVLRASELLRGSGVAVDAAVGFPHGAMSWAAKMAEVKECIRSGATELDVAINVLAVKSGCFEDAAREFREITAIAAGKAKVKAVFEHCLYSDEEKVRVLSLVRDAGVDFVKIQNMLSGKGASVEDVRFVREHIGPLVGIKIDGGVKTLAFAEELISAGADRIGLTATEAIAKEAIGMA